MNIKKLYHGFTKATDIWCVFLMAAMTVGVILGVFLRYVFSITFVWYEEMITMLFLAISFFGMVMALRDNENIRITYFFDKFPPRLQWMAKLLTHLMIVGVEFLVIVMSKEWIMRTGDVLTPGLRVPFRFFYLMVPISAAMMLFLEGMKIVCQFQDLFAKNKITHQEDGVKAS